MAVKPFIKWVGGKGKLLTEITDQFPPTAADTYYEPFLGGGSVLIAVLSTPSLRGRFKKIIAGDLNSHLIGCYEDLKTQPEELIRELEALTKAFNQAEDPQNFYYAQRAVFNEDKTRSVKRSALLIFLNKTCFRGLYRENKAGGFNCPYGNYKNLSIGSSENLRALSAQFSEVEFITGSYLTTLATVSSGDFVYMDPPYCQTFTAYCAEGFCHEDFFQFCDNLPCNWVMSNSKSAATTALISQFSTTLSVSFLSARRAINSKDPSSKAEEVLIAHTT